MEPINTVSRAAAGNFSCKNTETTVGQTNGVQHARFGIKDAPRLVAVTSFRGDGFQGDGPKGRGGKHSVKFRRTHRSQRRQSLVAEPDAGQLDAEGSSIMVILYRSAPDL